LVVVLTVVAYITFDLLPPRLLHPQEADARWLARLAAVGFLNVLLVAYGLTLMAVLTGIVVVAFFSRRKTPRHSSVARSRLLLLGVSLLVSLLGLEAGAAAWQAWLHRSPRLPEVTFRAEATAMDAGASRNPTAGTAPSLPKRFPPNQRERDAHAIPLRILVIGESSGRGEPYNPWISVGQIVAWRLEPVFPGRPIEVDIWATGGATLEMMHSKLAALSYRPDALIVYVGHNEFQARYTWMREVDHYLDVDRPPRVPLFPWLTSLGRFSPVCRLIQATREHQLVDMVPPRVVTRELIDRPVCTATEAAAILGDFHRRLEAIAEYCETIGTLPIFIIPPSNDAGVDPSRSILAPETPKQERIAFARAVARARTLERKDRDEAIRIDRELVRIHPEFAESHYRLGRLLEQTGCWDEARRHYMEAREGDAMPLRCPEPFRDAYRAVAARHAGLLLVDGPKVLEAKSHHGIVDDRFFHDAQHPNLRGYAALAEEVLTQLGARHALGWPAVTRVPAVDAQACARHFRFDAARWQSVCSRESRFFRATAYIRFDPEFRNQRAAAYDRAAVALRAGVDPAEAGIPGWPLPPKPTTTRVIP